MSNKLLVAIILIVAVGFSLLFATTKPQHSAAHTTVSASLASLSTGQAPWDPEYTHLADRLQAINMPLLGTEGTALHIHIHLDIFVHGHRVAVPAEIGIPPSGGITPLHTHDTTGVIHVESPDAHATYTLGQFFDIWGVKLTTTSIGGYSNNTTDSLAVYDNGSPVTDPAKLDLAAHHEITITYGTPSEQPSPIPSSYQFAAGL